MTDERAERVYCAHIRVGYDPVHLPGGLMRERWECLSGCGMEFKPVAALDQEARERRVDDGCTCEIYEMCARCYYMEGEPD